MYEIMYEIWNKPILFFLNIYNGKCMYISIIMLIPILIDRWVDDDRW